ncbi:MAG: hypothetical protein ACTHOD_11780 [Motilibacteraceae bacterium]
MTTTFVTRTADLMPALQPALAQVAAQAPCVMSAAPVQGTAVSAATTGLVRVITPAERHVAVIGTRQVSPVYGTAVVGSNGSFTGSNVSVGSAVFGKGDVPALRTWRPPV